MDSTISNQQDPLWMPKGRFLVGISGGSASGKTTLAKKITALAPDKVTLLELDRFYRPLQHGEEAEAKNYDHPKALDFELLHAVCNELKTKGTCSVPIYDFSRHDRAGMERIDANPIIVVEGILALWDQQICDLFECRLFVDAPTNERFTRRLKRDQHERGRNRDSVQKQWIETVEPMYEQFVKPTQARADQTIDGTSDLDIVAANLLLAWQTLR
jgi:uridine kinase